MKKIAAVLLSSLMIVSFAACNKNDGNSGAGSETSQVEIDENAKKVVAKYVDETKVGPKTKDAIYKLEGKTLTLSLKMEFPKGDDNSNSPSIIPGLDLSSLGTELELTIIKDADEQMRINGKIGSINAQIVKNNKGTYLLDTEGKTYMTLSSADEEGSQSSSNTTVPGPSLNLDSMESKAETAKDTVSYEGDGSEKYKNKDYSTEKYKFKSDGKESTMKLYFADDKLEYIVLSSDGSETAVQILALSKEIDESALKIPDDYKESNDALKALGSLGLFFGGMTAFEGSAFEGPAFEVSAFDMTSSE